MNRMQKEYDATIIGGGAGGLAVGALLAGEGLRTLMVEKTPHLGGRYRSIEFAGCRADNGVHIISGIFEKMEDARAKKVSSPAYRTDSIPPYSTGSRSFIRTARSRSGGSRQHPRRFTTASRLGGRRFSINRRTRHVVVHHAETDALDRSSTVRSAIVRE